MLTVSLLPGAVLADDAAADGSDGQSVTISLNTLIRKKLISSVPFEKLPQTKFTLTFIGGKSIPHSDPAEGITLPQMPGARLKWVISPDVTAEITADSMTGSDGGYTAEVPFLFTGSDLGEGYSLHNGYLTVTEVGSYEFYAKETADGVEDMSYCETDYKVVFEIVQDAQTGKLSVRDKALAYSYTENGDEKIGELAGEETSSGIYVVDSTWRIENTYTGAGGEPDAPIDLILAGMSEDTGMLNREDHFAYVVGYPDGAIHPNGQITRAEAATIFFRLLRDEIRDDAFTSYNDYADVADGAWYCSAVSTMSALGIITGYPDGTFRPDKPITRAELAAIASRFDECRSGRFSTFSDVVGHWAEAEICDAYASGWLEGYPDGSFKPDRNVTRAEAMAMINRMLERTPESASDLLGDMNRWTDNMDTSMWYYLDVQEATNSHAYAAGPFGGERWYQMRADPDWSGYER